MRIIPADAPDIFTNLPLSSLFSHACDVSVGSTCRIFEKHSINFCFLPKKGQQNIMLVFLLVFGGGGGYVRALYERKQKWDVESEGIFKTLF